MPDHGRHDADHGRALAQGHLDFAHGSYGTPGRLGAAIEHFTSAIECDPANLRSYFHRAKCLFESGQHQDALHSLDFVIRESTARPGFHGLHQSTVLLRASCFDALAQFALGRDELDGLLSAPGSSSHSDVLDAASRLRDVLRSKADLKQNVESSFRSNDLPGALEAARSFLSAFPDDSWARSAVVTYEALQPQGLRLDYFSSSSDDEDGGGPRDLDVDHARATSASAHQRGQQLLDSENYAAALHHFAAAISHAPHHDLQSNLLRASCLVELRQDLQCAVDDCTLCLATWPECSLALRTRARARMYLFDFDGALQDASLLCRVDPTCPDSHSLQRDVQEEAARGGASADGGQGPMDQAPNSRRDPPTPPRAAAASPTSQTDHDLLGEVPDVDLPGRTESDLRRTARALGLRLPADVPMPSGTQRPSYLPASRF